MFISYTSRIGRVYEYFGYQNLTNEMPRGCLGIIDYYRIDQNPLFAYISYGEIMILIGMEKVVMFVIFLNYPVSFDPIILYSIIEIAFFERVGPLYSYNIYIYKVILVIKWVDRNLVD